MQTAQWISVITTCGALLGALIVYIKWPVEKSEKLASTDKIRAETRRIDAEEAWAHAAEIQKLRDASEEDWKEERQRHRDEVQEMRQRVSDLHEKFDLFFHDKIQLQNSVGELTVRVNFLVEENFKLKSDNAAKDVRIADLEVEVGRLRSESNNGS